MSIVAKESLWVSDVTIMAASDLKGLCGSLLYALEMASKDEGLTDEVLQDIVKAYARASKMCCDIANQLNDATAGKHPSEY